jgi:cytochrome c heme-lyase
LRFISECASIRLLRFCGKPQDYSPKARLMNLLGYKLPFDRHDWVIDRCGKEVRAGVCIALHGAALALIGCSCCGVLPFHQVRYVIDFYNAAPEPGKPIGMHLDVRPALDSPQAAVDRLRMQLRWIGILAQQQQQQQQAPPESKPAV